MSFDSAIPVNRIVYGQAADFDKGSQEESAYGQKEERSAPKQSVNISQETMMKVARAKLGRMVNQKAGYTQRGTLSPTSYVGSLLSAKA
ncbi:hypothetical protein [Pelagicoccus mobilis]|uniref:Uncharacterized protein n=1 Tax=Pelagicoccus mobilis TaxID=415221 RepID=A0A934RYQ9_9BACT|nr:hypothetical protein [Pelagicoccus mobilis]MBK1880180.1 hypothetical protein [Pelagicoccus mobilis]